MYCIAITRSSVKLKELVTQRKLLKGNNLRVFVPHWLAPHLSHEHKCHKYYRDIKIDRHVEPFFTKKNLLRRKLYAEVFFVWVSDGI